jgi:hypothetical protein
VTESRVRWSLEFLFLEAGVSLRSVQMARRRRQGSGLVIVAMDCGEVITLSFGKDEMEGR